MRRALAMSSISALALAVAAGGSGCGSNNASLPDGGGLGGSAAAARRQRGWRRRWFGAPDDQLRRSLRADRSDRGHRRHGDARLHDGPRGRPRRRVVGGRRSDVAGCLHHAERRRPRRADPGRPLRQPVRDARDRPGLHGVVGAQRVDGLGLRRRRRPRTAAEQRRLPHRRHLLGAHRRHVVEQGPLRDQRQVLASRGRQLRRRRVDGRRLLRHVRRRPDPADTTWRQYRIPFGGLTQRDFGLPRPAVDSSTIYTIEFNFNPVTPFDFWLDDISFY